MTQSRDEVVSRSVRIEIVGSIERCHTAEDSKFYCLPVEIHFENGTVKRYLLKSHNEPKGLENFLQNKKGIKDKLERSFVLLRNGEIRIQYNSADIG